MLHVLKKVTEIVTQSTEKEKKETRNVSQRKTRENVDDLYHSI